MSGYDSEWNGRSAGIRLGVAGALGFAGDVATAKFCPHGPAAVAEDEARAAVPQGQELGERGFHAVVDRVCEPVIGHHAHVVHRVGGRRCRRWPGLRSPPAEVARSPRPRGPEEAWSCLSSTAR